MATIFDLIEVTGIFENTTYSVENGNLLGVVDGAVSSEFNDGEFDEGDIFSLGGTNYQIVELEEPQTSGSFVEGDGTVTPFNPQSESNLDVVFLTAWDGSSFRYFIIPSDGYGDLNFQEINTGLINPAAGSDTALVSTTNNNINAVCFAGGTQIRMADGTLRDVEDIEEGDRVMTLDRGAQTVRWVGRKTLSVPTLLRQPKLRPIRIPAGALGAGVPERDLWLSPQHRVLVRSRIARRMFDSDEVLVAAKHLVGVNGIEVDRTTWKVTYVHVLLDNHEVLMANGAPCESLFLGPQSRKVLGGDALEEIEQIFGGLPEAALTQAGARPLIAGRRARRMSERHAQNDKPLLRTA